MQPATITRPGTRRPVVGEWDAPSVLELFEFLHPAWHSRGLCRQYPELDWFPSTAGWSADTETVKDICRSCPVQDECLAAAVADLSLTGIWGGTSHRERRRMRR